jgi:hypothetical protein
MPVVKLYYFNVRGLVETTRQLLDYGNVDYEDVRISFDQLAELKPSKRKCEFHVSNLH